MRVHRARLVPSGLNAPELVLDSPSLTTVISEGDENYLSITLKHTSGLPIRAVRFGGKEMVMVDELETGYTRWGLHNAPVGFHALEVVEGHRTHGYSMSVVPIEQS